MKKAIVIILVILGLYWLFDHHQPLPLNHDSLGLYAHGIHRIIGIIFIVIAALVATLWKKKMPQMSDMSKNTMAPKGDMMNQQNMQNPGSNSGMKM